MLTELGFDWASNIISFGALVAITSVVLTILYGQTRIMFAMCRDGLLPRGFAKISARRAARRCASRPTFGVLCAAVAAFVPLGEIAKLVNIGTLFAFVITNIGVIVLRRTRPDLERGFRVPLVPWFPIIGAAAGDLPDEVPRARHVGPLRASGSRSASRSTSSTGAGTRCCSAARSSTRRRSC